MWLVYTRQAGTTFALPCSDLAIEAILASAILIVLVVICIVLVARACPGG